MALEHPYEMGITLGGLYWAVPIVISQMAMEASRSLTIVLLIVESLTLADAKGAFNH